MARQSQVFSRLEAYVTQIASPALREKESRKEVMYTGRLVQAAAAVNHHAASMKARVWPAAK